MYRCKHPWTEFLLWKECLNKVYYYYYVRSYEAGHDRKSKNNGDNELGGNRKESPGKEVEVVWACDAKRGTLHRKEGDGNESTREKEERKEKKGRPKKRWHGQHQR